MDYIRTEAEGQLKYTQSTDFLRIPSCLYGFVNESTSTRIVESGRTVILFKGFLMADDENLVCDCCGTKMHVNNHPRIMLSHLPFGGYLSNVSITRNQYACPKCGATKTQYIFFKSLGHRITVELHQYVCDLLSSGTYTN